jgi:hypothetical protein
MTSERPDRPRICLAMIVRNEADVIGELIGTVAGLIDSWVIVDTGSDDGTQAVTRRLMAERDIPGELHERPWVDFGHNRSEALGLAQGHGDYIWMMDADDRVVGTIDFGGLSADAYLMRFHDGATYWRRQLFRAGLPWRYRGVLHEVAVCDVPFTQEPLEGDYRIQSRRLGARNRDPQKYARDAELLQAEVDRDPTNTRSIFYLAQSYRDAGDPARARQWYERRAAMGGWAEEVFYSLYQAAAAREQLGEPWPDVQDAYLRAWSNRPGRAEPLHAIARRNRVDGRYAIGHLFAKQAAAIRWPVDDALFVQADVYTWRALDEQAVCASWIGNWAETLDICDRLLACDGIPEKDRARIAGNRDLALSKLRPADAARGAAATVPGTASKPLFIGLGHPRCGTGFTASLLQAGGLDVRHEEMGTEGLVSWMQVAKRGSAAWGDTLAEYPPGSRLFLVARSPLAALDSVATENQQIRSIGLRSQLIWERRRIDIFARDNQTAGDGVYDFFGWAVMSLAWWYDICLEEQPELIFRIEHPEDDRSLGDLVERPITRAGKHVWQNAYGPHKKSERLAYPISELGRVGRRHLAKLAEVAERLGYPQDAHTIRGYLASPPGPAR